MIANVFGSMAVSMIVKATLVVAFGLAGAWLARKNRAALRHAWLAATFGVLLALPIASMVAPPVRFAVPGEHVAPVVQTTRVIPSAAPERATGSATLVVSRAGLPLLLVAWIAGAAVFLLPVIIGLWQVRSLRRSAVPWRRGQSIAEELAREAGITRRVEVLMHEGLTGPMTCGILHPAIVLSEDAETWGEEDLNRAIVHELEHVRRGDWLTHCVARAVCALYWFHPLVWIAWRRLTLEEERACDDAVLRRSDASAYADQLVGLAKRMSLSHQSPIVGMASRADLAARVGAVLDSGQKRGRAGKFSVWLACVAAALVVITMSPLRIIAAPQSTGAPVVQFSVTEFFVVEDVIVSDRDGKSIEGLSASDFTVAEDGVPQAISLFEFQRVADGSKGAQSYYILGYYTKNGNLDGKVRHVTISGNQARMAKLDYRAGFTPRAPIRAVVSSTIPRTDTGITPPVIIRKVEAEYSEEARKAKWQGTVVLAVEVDASGQVSDTRLVRALGLGLDQKAIEAVRQWKFKPGTKDGKPVAVETQVDVSFRLL